MSRAGLRALNALADRGASVYAVNAASCIALTQVGAKTGIPPPTDGTLIRKSASKFWPMIRIARETGGFALIGGPDADGGYVRLAQDVDNYYALDVAVPPRPHGLLHVTSRSPDVSGTQPPAATEAGGHFTATQRAVVYTRHHPQPVAGAADRQWFGVLRAGDADMGARRRRDAAVDRAGQADAERVIESFNGRFRDECLNEHWFTSLALAQVGSCSMKWFAAGASKPEGDREPDEA